MSKYKDLVKEVKDFRRLRHLPVKELEANADGSANILIWDIESTDLKADFGICLCIGYKFLGEQDVHVVSVLDHPEWSKTPWDDSHVWRQFAAVFEKADLSVTYFGTGFDRPYMYAKFLKHGIPIPANIPMVDLFYTVKSNMALSRKSLANVSEFLELEATKTPVTGEHWLKASLGNKESIKYIVDHCKADINLTEELYLKLRPLIRTHPRVHGFDPCRTCGSTKIQKRGYSLSVNVYRKQRVQCQVCGSWDTRPIAGPHKVA